jgi:hypothetical protein
MSFESIEMRVLDLSEGATSKHVTTLVLNLIADVDSTILAPDQIAF